MRPSFRDPVHQLHFDSYGWVKVPLLPHDAIRAIAEGFRALAPRFPQGFGTSYTMDDTDVKLMARAIIKPVMDPRIADLLVDSQSLSHSFVTKGNTEASRLGFHQDWSFVDESRGFISLNIWCPLVDTDAANGNLAVVSGTHRLPRIPRPVSREPSPYDSFRSLYECHAVEVPTSLGEAIVFDNSLFHGSPANRIPEMRVVASVVAIAAEAEPVFYYRDVGDRVSMCAIDEEFLLHHPIRTVRSNRLIRSFDMPAVSDPEAVLRQVLGGASGSC